MTSATPQYSVTIKDNAPNTVSAATYVEAASRVGVAVDRAVSKYLRYNGYGEYRIPNDGRDLTITVVRVR